MEVDILPLLVAGLWGLIMSVWSYNLTLGKKDQQTRLNHMESDLAVLKEVKMDEAKTRQIVADSLEPLRHGQEELRADVKMMITAISNLSVQVARAGLMRHDDSGE